MSCFSHEEGQTSCKLIPSLIKEACTYCCISSCLKSPSSLSSYDEEEETLSNSDLDNKDVIIFEIRSRAMKAKTKPKDYLFANSLHWVSSPTTGKLLIAPKEERCHGEGREIEGDYNDEDESSEVFYSVKSCFSRCSSEKEVKCYLKEFRGRSIWEEFCHCEGWPFGLCRRALMLPPLPSSPSDSWTWRKRNVVTNKPCLWNVSLNSLFKETE